MNSLLLITVALFSQTACRDGICETKQHRLDVWCLDCPNELAFWVDYKNDQAFRDTINRHFVVRRIDMQHNWAMAVSHGIRIGPTYCIDGRKAIVGYRGKDVLLGELGLKPERRQQDPSTEAPSTQAPPQADPPSSATNLEQLLQEAEGRIQQRLEVISHQQKYDVEQLRLQINQQGAELNQKLQNRLSDAPLWPANTPGASGETKASQPYQTLPNPAVRQPWWMSKVNLLGSVWSVAQLGLALAGGTATLGGGTAAIWALRGMYRAWKSRRPAAAASPARSSPMTSSCLRCEQLQQEVQTLRSRPAQTETRFVTVPEIDPVGEAYKEAIRKVSDLKKEAIPFLNLVEAAAAQILQGKQVKQRAQSHNEAKPGMWSDET